MRSFQTRPTMWATDWPVTRRTTQSPTPLPSTLPCPSCLNNPTTHKRPQRPAAAAPPRPKTPSLPPPTRRPSSNTLRYRGCHPHPRGWQRTLFPRSSTCELINSNLFTGLSQNVSTEEVVVLTWTGTLRYLHRCGQPWKSNDKCSFCFSSVQFAVKDDLTVIGWVMFYLKNTSNWMDRIISWCLIVDDLSFYPFDFVKNKKGKKNKEIIFHFYIFILSYTILWQSPLLRISRPHLLIQFPVLMWCIYCACILYHACFSLKSKKQSFLFTEDILFIYKIDVLICGLCGF